MDYFVVPDLYGKLWTLEKAFAEYKEKYSDRMLLFLGDYIDRGKESAQIIELLIGCKFDYFRRIELSYF